MLLKITGAAIVVLSFAYAGHLVSSYEARKVKESEAFLNLIRHIRSRIACYKTPLPDIISAYSNRELEECGFLGGFTTSWNDALAASDKLHVDDTVMALLEEFGKEIGTSYKDEQAVCCDYYIEKLDAHICMLRGELQKKQKLARTLALVLGMLVVIILM